MIMQGRVLDHYFRGKDDILLQALYASHARIHARLRVLLAGRTGLDALRAMLLDLLPVEQQRLAETQLEMYFWARSLTDPLLAKAYEHESGTFRAAVLRYVGGAVADGSLPSGLDAVAAAEQLHAFLDGLSVHAAVEPTRLPPERQTVLLDRELDSLAGRTR